MLKVLPVPGVSLHCICNQNQVRNGTGNSMSEKQYSESFCDTSRSDHRETHRASSRDRRYGGRSSAEDPAISSTRSNKRVQSNSRDHPRAEVGGGGSSNSRDHPRAEVGGGGSSNSRDHPRVEVGGGGSSTSRDHPRAEVVGGGSSTSRDPPRVEVGGGGKSSTFRDHPRAEVGGGGKSSTSRDHPRGTEGGRSSTPRDHLRRAEVGGGNSSTPRDHLRGAEVGGGNSSTPRDHLRGAEVGEGNSSTPRDHLRGAELGGGNSSTPRDHLRGAEGGNSSTPRDYLRGAEGGNSSTPRDHLRGAKVGEENNSISSRNKLGEHGGQSNHSSSSGKSHSAKRRRPSEVEEEESVWTEHASSQGKVYYYNKVLDKSQWEKPVGVIKKAKEDATPTDPSKLAMPISKDSIKDDELAPKSAPSPHLKHSPHAPVSKRSFQEPGHRGRHGDKSYGRGNWTHGHRNQSSPKDHGVLSHHTSPRSRRSSSRSGSVSHSSNRSMGSSSSNMYSTPSKAATNSLATPPSLSAKSATPLSMMTPVFATPQTPLQLASHTPDHHTAMLLQQYASSLGDGATLVQMATPQNAHHYTHLHPSRTKLTYSPTNGPFADHLHLQGTPVSTSMGYMVQQQSPLAMPGAFQQASSLTLQQNPLAMAGPFQQASSLTLQQSPLAMAGPFQQASSLTLQQSPLAMAGPFQQASSLTLQQATSMVMHHGASSLTNIDGMGGLHPLQKALLLQNLSQGYGTPNETMSPLAIKLLGTQGAMVTGSSPGTPLTGVPSYFTSQGSHPSSPLPHSPMNNPSTVHGAVYVAVSSSPAPTTYYIAPNAGFVTLSSDPAANSGGGAVPPSSSSPWAQLPMSRLNLEGKRGSYPDPASVQSVPQPAISMELLSRTLAEPWLSHSDQLSKQLDNACHDSFSKRVADSIYHSGLVAQCQLRRDAVRSKSSSIEERLKSLRILVKEIEESRSL